MTEPQFTTEELNSEEWKSIPGYDNRYEISNLGRLRGLHYRGRHRVKLLNPSPNSKGYVICCLYENGKPRSIAVHVLVASAFCVRHRDEQRNVNHKDLVKHNNRASNLEWNTAKEDAEHRVRHGHVGRGDTHGSRTHPERVPRGSRHGTKTKPSSIARGSRQGMAKITEEIALQMRIRYATVQNYRQVAGEFGVSETNTHRIVKANNWKHVPVDGAPISKPDHKGTNNAAAKLLESDILLIRQSYEELKNYRAVARKFGLSETNATRIVKRQSWKHVE